MSASRGPHGVHLFSTCPPIDGTPDADYLQRVVDTARWVDRVGYRGTLVYTDNRLLDPWLVAQVIVQNTTELSPLVAVQPVYMHPYTVAKLVTSIGNLYGRRLYLNMVAGGFRNDLIGLNDPTSHDDRYRRLEEYTTIIKLLLESPAPVSYAGTFYRIDKIRLMPALPSELRPGIFLSGSSAAGRATARALGATAVTYPEPRGDAPLAPPPDTLTCGVRIGIIARAREEDAWAVAHARFPADRKGQLTHQMAMKTSDSAWHQQLSAVSAAGDSGPYWLVPFQHYKTFCPYLVGSYERVASELAHYLGAGYRTFLLDVPRDEEDVHHTHQAFARALGAPATSSAA